MWGCFGRRATKNTYFSTRLIPLTCHFGENSKSRKAKTPAHISPPRTWEKRGKFSPLFPPSSSTSRIHNSTSYCRQRSNATRKIENENHLSPPARAPTHPPFEPQRVSLVEAIYYREMASGLANTYTRRWKFIVICVVFPYVQISLSPFTFLPNRKPKKICLFWLLFFLFSSPRSSEKCSIAPSCLRVRCTANVYVASYNNNSNGYDEAKKKKKGRITYIKRQLDRWKVCFFILRKNILRTFSNFGGDVMCFPFSSPQCVSLARNRKPFGEKGHNFALCPVIILGIWENFPIL